MLCSPAGARCSQIRSQDIQYSPSTDWRRSGAAFCHDVYSARLDVKLQSWPFAMWKKKKRKLFWKKKKSNCFNSNFHLLFISFDLKIFFDLFSSLFPCQSSCSPLENNWPALLIDQITPRNNPFLFLKERFSFFFTWNSLCLAIDGPVAADGQIQNRSQSYFLCL
jgi:hypothetical protein